MARRDVTFRSGDDTCAAWLYTPDTPGPHPIVVMAHGFGGVRTARLWAFAERFEQAGMAALVFDYRHFGESTGEPRQLLDIARQHDDYRAAVAFARGLDEVDADRVALWGTSFSGGHVAVIAAEDHRIAAVVSQGPYFDGLWALKAAGPPDMLRMTVAGLRDESRRLLRRPPYLMPIVAPPRNLAVMNSPDAEPGYKALFSEGDEFRNEVIARIVLRVGPYRPVRYAAKVACPWLFCICDRDGVTPPQPALKAASKAPRSEVRRYDTEHFEIYVGEMFERVVADEVAFLERHLLGKGRRFSRAPGAMKSMPAAERSA